MLYVVSGYRTCLLIESEYMDYAFARSLVRQKYPIRFLLRPVRYECLG